MQRQYFFCQQKIVLAPFACSMWWILVQIWCSPWIFVCYLNSFCPCSTCFWWLIPLYVSPTVHFCKTFCQLPFCARRWIHLFRFLFLPRKNTLRLRFYPFRSHFICSNFLSQLHGSCLWKLRVLPTQFKTVALVYGLRFFLPLSYDPRVFRLILLSCHLAILLSRFLKQSRYSVEKMSEFPLDHKILFWI